MSIADADPAADDSAVRDLVARASSAQNDRDEFLSLHTVDVIIVNLAGRRVLGRVALADAMTAALESPLSEVRTNVEIADIRFPTPDIAVVSCLKTVHDDRTDAERTSLPASGALTYLMLRTNGGWRISHAQTTPILG